MSVRERLHAWAKDRGIELILFDPPAHFDAAIIGVVVGFSQEPAVLYDQDKVISLMVADGMEEDEAVEWFEFNTIGSWVGESTPRFLIRPQEDDR